MNRAMMPKQMYAEGGVASLARDIYMPEGAIANLMTTDDSIRSDMEALRQSNPEAFQAMMDRNTEANIQRLNRLQFEQDEMVKGSPLPAVDRYLADRAVYSTQIPPGFEDVEYLERGRTTAGVNISSRPTGLTERTFVTGNPADQVLLHEAAHSEIPNQGSFDAFMAGAEGREEAAVTGMDLYRAFKSDKPEEFTSSINYLAKQGVNMFYPPDLMRLKDNIVKNIVFLSEKSGNPISSDKVAALESDVERTVIAAGKKASRLRREAVGYANGGGVQSLAPQARMMFRR